MPDSSAQSINAPDLTPFQKKTVVTRFTPASGDTITIPDNSGDIVIILAPAADLAALTITWPSNPYQGQSIRILSTKNIATVSHLNGTLNRAVTALIASGDMNCIYDATGLTYMSDGVTSSQIVSLPYAATVAGGSGNAVVFPTDSGLVGGNAIFSSIQDINVKMDVADPNVAFAKPVVSNANKTVTVNVQKQTFNVITLLATNILGSATLGVAPNGVAITILIHGVLA